MCVQMPKKSKKQQRDAAHNPALRAKGERVVHWLFTVVIACCDSSVDTSGQLGGRLAPGANRQSQCHGGNRALCQSHRAPEHVCARAELVAKSVVLQVGKGRRHRNVYARGIRAS